MIKALFFDIGGVLAHDVWEALLLDEQIGIAALHNLDRAAVWHVAQEIWKRHEHLPATTQAECDAQEQEYWQLFLQNFPINVAIPELIAYTDQFMRPVLNMNPLLAELKAKGHTLLICSNNNEFWFRKQARVTHLYQYFDEDKLILSQRVRASKWSPNHEMFKAGVQAAGVTKEECLLIDDRAENMHRANEFGMPALLFPAHAPYGADYLRAVFKEMKIL